MKKLYLSGVDWIINGLDHMTKEVTGIGSNSQIVLECEGDPIPDEFQTRLLEFIANSPVFFGSIRRDFKLAPYWEVPDPIASGPLAAKSVSAATVKDESAALKVLEEAANTPFPDPRSHLSFRFINAGDKTFPALCFDHRLLDAWGAETLIWTIHNELAGPGRSGWRTPAGRPANLCNWKEKFEAGKEFNRSMIELAENAPPIALRPPSSVKKPGFKFKLLCFSKEQTSVIERKAVESIGYPMVMPFLLGASVCAFHEVAANRGQRAGDYIIPVSVNTRPTNGGESEILFNHLSFLYFRVPSLDGADFKRVLDSCVRQMYEQVKKKMPQKLCESGFLLRIAPVSLLNRFLKLYLKGEFASFSFSYVGENVNAADRFAGRRVLRLFHMPRVPVPPGMGIFFNKSHEKLTCTLSYLDGLLDGREVEQIADSLRYRLGVA